MWMGPLVCGHMAVPAMSELTAGINQADSWATDFHKWLNVPYDSGLALVRDAEALQAAMAVTAEYLPTSAPLRRPIRFCPGVVPAGAGGGGMGRFAFIRPPGGHRNDRAQLQTGQAVRRRLPSAGFDVLNQVVLNQVLVSFGDPEKTNRIIAGIQTEGTCWCGGTVWHGRTAMRISVCSWATTDQDVERSLEAMLRVARNA